jgi:hypothetical protein
LRSHRAAEVLGVTYTAVYAIPLIHRHGAMTTRRTPLHGFPTASFVSALRE